MTTIPRPENDIPITTEPELDPAEERATAEECAKELAEGNIGGGFDDILDELHSDGPTMAEQQAQRDEQMRHVVQFCSSLRVAITRNLLRSQGMMASDVSVDTDDLVLLGKDRQQREYDVRVPLQPLLALESQLGPEPKRIFDKVVDILCEQLLRARARYFERMGETAP